MTNIMIWLYARINIIKLNETEYVRICMHSIALCYDRNSFVYLRFTPIKIQLLELYLIEVTKKERKKEEKFKIIINIHIYTYTMTIAGNEYLGCCLLLHFIILGICALSLCLSHIKFYFTSYLVNNLCFFHLLLLLLLLLLIKISYKPYKQD